MNLLEWLNGLQCAAPFTVTDAGELYSMIKTQVASAIVDVHITPAMHDRPEEVHVAIASATLKYTRTYAVVTR